MRKLFASTLLLLPAAALAAPPTPATPAAPAVSVTTPAVTATVRIPAISVKIQRSESGDSGAALALSGTVPVPAKVTNLDLQVRVGQLHIRTADTDHIEVKLRATQGGAHGNFIFHWTTGKSSGSGEVGGLPKDLHLVALRHDDTIVMCVNPHKSKRTCDNEGADEITGWKADWQIVVPARMHLKLDGGVADASIRGIAGGVRVHLGVGKLNLALPNGPVNARVGVGSLDVRVKSPDYGRVVLSAGVGKTQFHVGGNLVSEGAHHEFTSSHQETKGPGETPYDLKVGTGRVSLKLGVKNPAAGMDKHD